MFSEVAATGETSDADEDVDKEKEGGGREKEEGNEDDEGGADEAEQAMITRLARKEKARCPLMRWWGRQAIRSLPRRPLWAQGLRAQGLGSRA